MYNEPVNYKEAYSLVLPTDIQQEFFLLGTPFSLLIAHAIRKTF